jgi:hypothetical protein
MFLHRYKVLKMTPSSDYVWILVAHWKLTSFLKVYGVDYNKIIQPCQNVLKETQPDNDGIRSIKCGNNIFIIEDVKENDVNSKHEYYLKVDNNSFNFQDFDSSWYSAVPVDSTTPVGRHLINCDGLSTYTQHSFKHKESRNMSEYSLHRKRSEEILQEITKLETTKNSGYEQKISTLEQYMAWREFPESRVKSHKGT